MPGPRETIAWLGLGGNLGDPEAAMRASLALLEADGQVRVAAVSALWRTPPWGRLDQPDYLNAVAEIATTLPPRPLLKLCLDTERRLKRVRGERWGPRLIDIDVLLYGDETVVELGLRIPHPRMLDRGFVMTPLAEIAPDLIVGNSTARSHAARLGLEGMTRQSGEANWWREA